MRKDPEMKKLRIVLKVIELVGLVTSSKSFILQIHF